MSWLVDRSVKGLTDGLKSEGVNWDWKVKELTEIEKWRELTEIEKWREFTDGLTSAGVISAINMWRSKLIVISGKPEVWAALKVAADAVGREDYDMAQALLDGAGVSLPGGTVPRDLHDLSEKYTNYGWVFLQMALLLIQGDHLFRLNTFR